MATLANDRFNVGGGRPSSRWPALRTRDAWSLLSSMACAGLFMTVSSRVMSYATDPISAEQMKAMLMAEPQPVRVVALEELRADDGIRRYGEPITQKAMSGAICDGRLKLEANELASTVHHLSADNLAMIDAAARATGASK